MYEFDLKTFLRTLWSRRRLFLINGGIALAVAIVIAFSIPRQYTSTVSLAPEMGDEGTMGGMSSLASLAGIDLGNSTDAIGPALYPDVVSSNAFLVDLLQVSVTTADDGQTMTFLEYLRTRTRLPWWAAATQGIRRGVTSLVGGSQPDTARTIDPQRLTFKQEALVGRLKGIVSCTVNDESGTIAINATAQDPLVAKILADTATKRLQQFVTQYRTNKARGDLSYYRQIENEARLAYEAAQREYARFTDSHLDIALQAYAVRAESLENELQLAYSNYSRVKQQVQMAEAKVQEQTPAFTVIEPASVANLPSAPRRKLIVIGLLFVTLTGTALWVYAKLLLGKYRQEQPAEAQEMQPAEQHKKVEA